MARVLVRLGTVLALCGVAGGMPGREPAPRPDPPAEPKAVPRLLYAVPLVARPGEKQKLTLRGRHLERVGQVKVAGTDGQARLLAARLITPPGNQVAERVGTSELEVELDLPAGARPGAVSLTAVSPAGQSPPYILLLRDDLPAVAEAEPNNGFDQAQPLTVPAAVEATIATDRDVDVFRFSGRKGQTWRFEVQAARYGSPVDVILTIYDARKRILESADETTGQPDPALTLILPQDGTYFVTVVEANDLGGPHYGYRLVIRPGPQPP